MFLEIHLKIMVIVSLHLLQPKLTLSDIHMGSPPPLHGSSSTSAGVLHGRAYGNVFNIADADKPMETDIGAMIGKVRIYNTGEDPSSMKPHMTIKAEVNQNIAPVLEDLGELYSPIKSVFVIVCF